MKIDQVYHKEGTWYCLPTGKWPNKPHDMCVGYCDGDHKCPPCQRKWEGYEESIASALKEAKPFEDQQHIETLVYGHPSQLTNNLPVNYFSWKEKLKDGLYSIPETEVELKTTCKCEGDLSLPCVLNSSYCEREQVARIVTLTPESASKCLNDLVESISEGIKNTSETKKPVDEKSKQLLSILRENKDDLGRTILTGAVADILGWHEKQSQSTIAQLQ